MEKQIQIKTKDGFLIYGTLAFSKKKSDKLIIIVHGLGGHRNEHIHFNASNFFIKQGFNVFRFDLYSWGKKARAMSNCSIKTHGKDLDTVTEFFGKKFKKLFVIGHSLGGLTILASHVSKFDAIVFWDPAHTKYEWKKAKSDFIYSKKLDKYIINWGTELLMSKEMFEELANGKDSSQSIKKIHKPIKIISAGKGVLQKTNKDYFKHANSPKEFVTIKADHNFNMEGTEEKLFNETLKFLKKYSK